MYDTFQPFKIHDLIEFKFRSSRYEIWQNGMMIEDVDSLTEILAEVRIEDGAKFLRVQVDNSNIYDKINKYSKYHVLGTSNDRLMYMILPVNTNAKTTAMQVLSQNYGYTCDNYNFKYQDPFTCQVFTFNGVTAKISFLFSNPERLIEFYRKNLNDLHFFSKNQKEEHKPIINFFIKHGFGTINPVLTYLSILSPDDRCTILEALYRLDSHNSILNDKLLLAYVTNGRRDLAEKLILNVINQGESQENVYFLKDKLDLGLAPHRTGAERIALYEDFKNKASDKTIIEFLDLAISFCKKIY